MRIAPATQAARAPSPASASTALRSTRTDRRDGRLGAVPPPDLEVERGRIGRPGEVRGVEQPGRSVDARARGRSSCDGGHESADDHRRGAGPADAEEDRRPSSVQPQLQPPERERTPTPGVGRPCNAVSPSTPSARRARSRPARRPVRAASSSACANPGTRWRRSGASPSTTGGRHGNRRCVPEHAHTPTILPRGSTTARIATRAMAGGDHPLLPHLPGGDGGMEIHRLQRDAVGAHGKEGSTVRVRQRASQKANQEQLRRKSSRTCPSTVW